MPAVRAGDWKVCSVLRRYRAPLLLLLLALEAGLGLGLYRLLLLLLLLLLLYLLSVPAVRLGLAGKWLS